MGRRRKSFKDMLIPNPVLLSRLNKYLESKKHEVAIDQNQMVEDLRTNYKEYEKKDKTAFRASVFRAYNYILEPLVNPSSLPDAWLDLSSVESGEDCDEEEIVDSDEVEVLDTSLSEGKSKNNGNVSYLQNLQGMANPNSRKEGKSTEIDKDCNHKEKSPVVDAIDISSDEEDNQSLPAHHSQPCSKSSSNHNLTISRIQNRSASVTRVPSLPVNPVSISVVPTGMHSLIPNSSGSPYKRKAAMPLMGSIKRRRETSAIRPTMDLPRLRLKDFGGHEKVTKSLNCLFQFMKYPEVYSTLGISPPTGFLLHGPPGSGKTLLAQCIAGELSLPLMKVVGTELVAGVSGESEMRIRSLFESARSSAPCVLFIDEVDAITQPREAASKDMERRIVAQLLSSFDDLHARDNEEIVIVLGATNRADSLDPALRRAGRFDREIAVGMPDRQTRADILLLLVNSLRLHPSFNVQSIAAATPGYVGSDLKALTMQAAYHAINRFMKVKERSQALKEQHLSSKSKETKDSETSPVEQQPEADTSAGENKPVKDQSEEAESKSKEVEPEGLQSSEKIVEVVEEENELNEILENEPANLENLYIENNDFMEALKFIQPSAKREGFATVPDVTWNDVGSLDHIREQLNRSIMMSVKYPEEFEKLGISSPTGVLMCGPPGCGKTLVAKAVANEANINFISVKGPELLNMYVGESEKAVRQVFQRARNSQPCVIFFDEIDALCPKRSDSAEGGGRVGSRIVNQLLTEMDGVEGGRHGVYMMAATNRPDMLDPAILRPGRFDKVLYVGFPSPTDRALVLKAITKDGTRPEFTSEVDLDAVGASEKCSGFSGADLAALVKEASVQALSEYINNNRTGELKVSNKHINAVLAKLKPSVSEEERLKYEIQRLLYSSNRPNEEKMEEDD